MRFISLLISSTLLMSSPLVAIGQDFRGEHPDYITDLPFDSFGLMTLVRTIETSGSKSEIYARGKGFVAGMVGADKDAYLVDDKENGFLIARLTSQITAKYIGISYPIDVYCSIKLETRDGRFRYTLNDFKYVTTQPDDDDTTYLVQNPSDLFSVKKYYNSSGKPKANNESIKTGTAELLKTLSSRIEAAMKEEEG